MVEDFAVLAGQVGAAPVSFLLDTGAQAHLILPDMVAPLGLRTLPGTVPMIGTGGVRAAPLVLLDRVRLSGVSLPAAPTPVAELPALPKTMPALAGLLGAPLLALYDLALDLPGGRLGLYPAGACGADVLGPGATTLPLEITAAGEALLTVQVNGQALTALLDTGSRATLLTEAAGRRLGLRAPISANTARGVDGERLPLEHVRVRELAVGADLRRDVPVSIAKLQLGRADMLLGLDYLRQRRAWISYASGQLGIVVPSPVPSAR